MDSNIIAHGEYQYLCIKTPPKIGCRLFSLDIKGEISRLYKISEFTLNSARTLYTRDQILIIIVSNDPNLIELPNF